MHARCAAALLLAALPSAALGQATDADYTRQIREYTTDPAFLTDLVDHLPASSTVPTPQKFLGYVVGTPERLTYAKDVHRYFRARPRPRRACARGRWDHRGGPRQILVSVSEVDNIGTLDRLNRSPRAATRGARDADAKGWWPKGGRCKWASGARLSGDRLAEMRIELGTASPSRDSLLHAVAAHVVLLFTPGSGEAASGCGRVPVPQGPSVAHSALAAYGASFAQTTTATARGGPLSRAKRDAHHALLAPHCLHDLHESAASSMSTGTVPTTRGWTRSW